MLADIETGQHQHNKHTTVTDHMPRPSQPPPQYTRQCTEHINSPRHDFGCYLEGLTEEDTYQDVWPCWSGIGVTRCNANGSHGSWKHPGPMASQHKDSLTQGDQIACTATLGNHSSVLVHQNHYGHQHRYRHPSIEGEMLEFSVNKAQNTLSLNSSGSHSLYFSDYHHSVRIQ